MVMDQPFDGWFSPHRKDVLLDLFMDGQLQHEVWKSLTGAFVLYDRCS